MQRYFSIVLFGLCLLIVLFTSLGSEINAELWFKYLQHINDARVNPVVSKSKCSGHAQVIYDDLKVWRERGGIKKQDMEIALTQAVHYQIIGNKLYRQEKCTFPSRCSGCEHFILEIIDDLPDMEFALNVYDWPRSPKYKDPMPVLSFSKIFDDHWDIMYPAWTFWEGGPAVYPLYPTGLGRWDIFRKDLAKKSDEFPWDKKMNVTFFRGSRTSSARDPLVLLSRKNPELVDAAYTKNQAWKSKKDTLGAEPADYVHLYDHCQYKNLFNFDGVAASFRLKYLFLCGSLVFHVGDRYQEFFYPALQEWYHYIPVSLGMNEVEDLLEFTQTHDDIMQKIAENGQEFIKKRLRMKDVSCYWKELLKKYAKLLQYDITKNPDLKEIVPDKKSKKKHRNKTEL